MNSDLKAYLSTIGSKGAETRECPRCGRQIEIEQARKTNWKITCECGAKLFVYWEDFGEETRITLELEK